MTKKQPETQSPQALAAEPPKFFEIVNWKKAQPKMSGRGNTWCKNYTSLLEHDGYASLDDTARNLIHMLWLYAARTGQHILPADPKWLHRQMPILNSEPNLKPLLETKDLYGRPTPFLRLCGPPGADGSGRDETGQPAADSGDDGGSGGRAQPKAKKKTARRPAARKAAKKPAAGKSAKKQKAKKTEKREEKRTEQRREDQSREDNPSPLRASDHPEEERKSLTGFSKEADSTAEQNSPDETIATAGQNAAEPEKPDNPTNPDAGAAAGHHVPRPSRSATRGPEAIADVLGRRFEPWWGDPDCEAFGWEIAGALGYSTDRLNLQSRNQWGNFAAWLWRAKQAAPSVVVEELRARAIVKANEIRTKRHRHVKNPGAVWTFIMDKELASHGVRLGDDRAGPAAVSK